MCHSDASLPPAAEGAVPAASDRPLVLTAADGTRVLAHEARPAAPTGVGVVVLPDIRGLHQYYRQLAVRFAEIGAQSIAVDYFGRTAPHDDRSEAFEFGPHVQQATAAGVGADVALAVEHLRGLGAPGSSPSVSASAAATHGGSRRRPRAGRRDRLLRPPGRRDGSGGPPTGTAAHAGRRCRRGDPVADTLELAERARAVVPVEHVVFEGAPHSFFDRTFADHAQDCARAWRQIQAFLAAHA